MLEDVLPVEVPVFGINDHPIQSQCHRHLTNRSGFQGDLQTADGFVPSQFLAEPLQGCRLHGLKMALAK